MVYVVNNALGDNNVFFGTKNDDGIIYADTALFLGIGETSNFVSVRPGLTTVGNNLQINGDLLGVQISNGQLLSGIDASKITVGAMSGNRIADASILNTKIESLSASKLTSGTIPTNRIADSSITDTKISGLSANKINAGTLSMVRIADDSIEDRKIHSVSANKIVSGTIGVSRGGTGATTSTGTGSVVLSDTPAISMPRLVYLNNYIEVGGANTTTIHLDFVSSAAAFLHNGDQVARIENGAFNIVSDDRIKYNEAFIENATATVNKLRPQIYDKRQRISTFKESGFIAQEVFTVPELRHLVSAPSSIDPDEWTTVSADPTFDPDYTAWGDELASVNYIGIIPYLTKAIQEKDVEIKWLMEKIGALEDRLAAIE